MIYKVEQNIYKYILTIEGAAEKVSNLLFIILLKSIYKKYFF